MSQKRVETALDNIAEDIQAIDDETMMEVVGVSQALDDLRKALDKVDGCLDKRAFREASSLGYSEVSSAFIFLQRTLGGLQQADDSKTQLISEFVLQAGFSSYEEAAPLIENLMASAKPRDKA